MLFEDLGDLIDTLGKVLDVGPLSERFSSPDQVLHVRILREICILQVLVIAQKEGREVESEV
jgi:hypothetical protein